MSASGPTASNVISYNEGFLRKITLGKKIAISNLSKLCTTKHYSCELEHAMMMLRMDEHMLNKTMNVKCSINDGLSIGSYASGNLN